MKQYIYVLLGLFLTMSCTTDSLVEGEIPADHTVELSFQTDIAEYETMTRSIDESSVGNLMVLVFEKEEGFLYRSEASSLGNGRFSVKLKESTTPKIIHFVANYDWSSFQDADYIKWPDTELIPQLTMSREQEKMSMWTYFAANDGITTDLFSGNNASLKLVRNMFKVSVSIKDIPQEQLVKFELLDYSLINTVDRGTIAPFNSSDHNFEPLPNTVTEAADAEPVKEVKKDVNSDEIYGYERMRGAEDKLYSALILKCSYNGEETYYKVAFKGLNDLDEVLLMRNYHYTVNLKSVTSQGYDSFNDAYEGIANNDLALELSLEKYPIISFGKEVLEVEKYHFVITNNASSTFNTWARYTDENGVLANSRLSIKFINVDPQNPVFSGEATISGGIIKASLTSIPTDESTKVGRIIVKPADSRLSRVIKVTLRRPFEFVECSMKPLSKISLTDIPLTLRGNEISMNIKVPYDKDMQFPFEIYFHLKWLVPTVDNELNLLYEWISDAKGAKYTYIVHKPETEGLPINLQFKFKLTEDYDAEKEFPAENIEILSSQFKPVYLGYNKIEKIEYPFKSYYKPLLGSTTDLPENKEEDNAITIKRDNVVLYKATFKVGANGQCSATFPNFTNAEKCTIQLDYGGKSGVFPKTAGPINYEVFTKEYLLGSTPLLFK